MLVLSRKSNQSLHIGNDIVVTIVRVRGDMVRIGIEAPKDVKIMRNELLEKLVERSEGANDCGLHVVAPENDLTVSEDRCGEASQAPDEEPASDCNTDEEPKSGGPLARFCKPQLRAIYATAT